MVLYQSTEGSAVFRNKVLMVCGHWAPGKNRPMSTYTHSGTEGGVRATVLTHVLPVSVFKKLHVIVV